MDMTRAARRNPYAARIARDGYVVNVKRGRPPKGSETGPTVTKSIRLPPEIWERLEASARVQGIALHALLRAALLAWLEQSPGEIEARGRVLEWIGPEAKPTASESAAIVGEWGRPSVARAPRRKRGTKHAKR